MLEPVITADMDPHELYRWRFCRHMGACISASYIRMPRTHATYYHIYGTQARRGRTTWRFIRCPAKKVMACMHGASVSHACTTCLCHGPIKHVPLICMPACTHILAITTTNMQRINWQIEVVSSLISSSLAANNLLFWQTTVCSWLRSIRVVDGCFVEGRKDALARAGGRSNRSSS
jgi:hypothetical protein